MWPKIPLILIIILNFLTKTQSLKEVCDENDRNKIDATYAKLLVVGNSGRKFPEDKKDQLKLFCDKTNEYISEADKYKDKCLKGMPKQVTAILVYSVRNLMKQYCKKDSKKLNDLIGSTPCINSAKKEIDLCYTKLIDKFLGAYNAQEKMRIPHICCEYYRFLECNHDKPVNLPKCNEKHIEHATNFIRELIGNISDFICGEYTEGSDKCDKIAPTPRKKKNQKRTKSFMIPLVDALASLSDEK